jgi:hypothetical protein
MITAADITDSQIAALRREARAAGDYDMANVCTIALGSEETATCADVMAAKRTCAEAINNAAAMAE